jgi:hypothetical protein
LALHALAESLNQGNGINLSNLFSSPSNQRPTVQNYPGLQADQSSQSGSGGLFGMFKPVSDVVSNLLTGVIGNRFSRRISKRSLTDENSHKIERRIVNLKESAIVQSQPNFFEASSNDQQQNTLYSLEEPFIFSNGNRIAQSETIAALKFPKENVQQEIPLSEINQGNFISPSDVVRRLKMLFPEAVGHLRFNNDEFNRELLKALVNDRIGKILTGVQRPINNNYDINRYQGNPNYINQNAYSQQYPAQSQNYYAGGSSTSASSNYNNFNTNHINRGQQQQQQGDRSHIVYITNAQGQIEYTLNELTGEKKRYY